MIIRDKEAQRQMVQASAYILRDDRVIRKISDIFEDIKVISELQEPPTGYVRMFTAEHTVPAKILIGRPVARLWKLWGKHVQRNDGPATEAIKQIAPSTLTEELVLWQAFSDNRAMSVAITDTPYIDMPEALEGWKERHAPLSAWINWK